MDTVQITDLYQAAYYILNGCELVGVECIPAGNSSSCQIGVQGNNLTDLAEAWFGKKAAANLWAFRNAYSQINSHVQQAKRSFEFARRQEGRV
jgi:hypothetical protein